MNRKETLVAIKKFKDGSSVEVLRQTRVPGPNARATTSTVYVFKRAPGTANPKPLADLTPRDLRRIAKKAEEIRQFLSTIHPQSKSRSFSENTYRR